MSGADRGRSPLRPDDPIELGGYRLLARLGEGGMGRVYLARSPRDRLVALKVIRPDAVAGEEARRRFRGEVARARQVPPFCTAEVLDADPDHEPPYLVVEYVDGPDLATVVREHGPLSPANLHAVAIGVATALTAIHGAGVIHRDLKPGNVLLAPGTPKVIDFGIAREVNATAWLTQTDQIVGTVGYMAPERLEPANHGELTPAADVFAWGAVVAYAGTGRAPFEADSLPAMAVRILTGPPDLDGLSDDLRPLVEQALGKDPAARPTARDLLDQLLAATPATVPHDRRDLLRTGSRHARVDPATLRPAARGRRRVAGLAAALCATLIAGAIIGAAVLAGGLSAARDALAPSDGPSQAQPSPAPSIPPGTGLIRHDRLTAPGYWEPRDDERHQASCAFDGGVDGGLVVRSERAASYRCPGPRDQLASLAVFVDVTLVDPGSCAAIWFRFSASDGGYALRVCQDGYYLVTHGRPEPSDVTTLRTLRLDLPLGTPVRVGIVADGETIRLYRAGEPVLTWSDGSYPTGPCTSGCSRCGSRTRRRTR